MNYRTFLPARSQSEMHCSKPLTPAFNRSIKISPSSQRLSSDGGALLLRELDQALGFTEHFSERLLDPRWEELCTYSMAELLRTRLFLIAQGWRDQNDANQLREDPALCAAVADVRGMTAADKQLASQSTHSRLIDTLARPANRHVLRDAPSELAIRCQTLIHKRPQRCFTLDLDSTPIETHGQQQGANYNGHYRETCYNPLLAFVAETGDLVGSWLRKGNCASQRGATAFALPLIDRLEEHYGEVADVRGDAAFADPVLMAALEQRDVQYVFRLKTNAVLDRLAVPYLTQPLGRPANFIREWTYELSYGAESWYCERRLVLVVVDDPNDRFLGKSVLRYFFLVTSFPPRAMNGTALLEHYRARGTAENWIGEFKHQLAPLLSSPRMADNRATLTLYVLAYQLAHSLRLLASKLGQRGTRLSISGLRERTLKVAVRFTRSARRLLVDVAESAWPIWQKLFGWLARHAPA